MRPIILPGTLDLELGISNTGTAEGPPSFIFLYIKEVLRVDEISKQFEI